MPSDFRRRRRPGQGLDANEVNQLVAHTEDLTRRLYGVEQEVQSVNTAWDNTILARVVGFEDEDEEDGGRRAYKCQWVHPSETLTAGRTNRWQLGTLTAHEYSDARDVPVDGSAIVVLRPDDTGGLYFDWHPTELDAEIISSAAGVYQCEQRFHDQSGTWANGTLTLEAREDNGRTDVANGTIVRVRRGYCSGAPRVEIDTIEDGNGTDQYDTQAVGIFASGGTYKLIFDETSGGTNPQTTGPIAWNANATTVQAALEALSNVGSVGITGNGTLDDRFTIEFLDSHANYLVMESVETDLEGDQEWLFGAGVASNGTTSGGNETALVRLRTFLGNNTWRGHLVTHGSNGTDPMDIVDGGNVTVYTGAFNSTLTSLGSGVSNYRADQTLLCKVTPFTDGSNLTICLPQYVEPLANLTVPGTVSTDNQSFNGTKNFAVGTVTIGTLGTSIGHGQIATEGTSYGHIELRYNSSNSTAHGDGRLILQNPTGFDSALVWAHQEDSATANGNAGFAMTFNGTRHVGIGDPTADIGIFAPGFGPNGTLAFSDLLFGGGLCVGYGVTTAFRTLTTDDIYYPTTGQNLTEFLDSL